MSYKTRLCNIWKTREDDDTAKAYRNNNAFDTVTITISREDAESWANHVGGLEEPTALAGWALVDACRTALKEKIMTNKNIINNSYDGDLGPILNQNNRNNTSIEIDFSGEELMSIAIECKNKNITFNEFIDSAIRNYLYKEENK